MVQVPAKKGVGPGGAEHTERCPVGSAKSGQPRRPRCAALLLQCVQLVCESVCMSVLVCVIVYLYVCVCVCVELLVWMYACVLAYLSRAIQMPHTKRCSTV